MYVPVLQRITFFSFDENDANFTRHLLPSILLATVPVPVWYLRTYYFSVYFLNFFFNWLKLFVQMDEYEMYSAILFYVGFSKRHQQTKKEKDISMLLFQCDTMYVRK